LHNNYDTNKDTKECTWLMGGGGHPPAKQVTQHNQRTTNSNRIGETNRHHGVTTPGQETNGVVTDGHNRHLSTTAGVNQLTKALLWIVKLTRKQRAQWVKPHMTTLTLHLI
jgi:hypothetical protein